MSAPLVVKMDPRVKTSAADLERQFQLASKLAAGAGEFSAAVGRADDLLKQIGARKKDAAGNAELSAALADLEKKSWRRGWLWTAGGGFGFFGFAVPGNEPTTLRQVSAAYGALLGIVESADDGAFGGCHSGEREMGSSGKGYAGAVE